MSNFQRKPILTINNRRNSDNHPEFLDPEALLERFQPLIKSLHHRFMEFNGIWLTSEDSNDLYNQIVFEFLKLRQSYDPKRGVDFTGYVKFHLQHRVYHYVMKSQKFSNKERLLLSHDDDEDNSNNLLENNIELVDEESEREIFKIEAMESIPWDKLNASQTELIKAVLLNGETIEQIAKSHHTTMRNINRQLEELENFLIEL